MVSDQTVFGKCWTGAMYIKDRDGYGTGMKKGGHRGTCWLTVFHPIRAHGFLTLKFLFFEIFNFGSGPNDNIVKKITFFH